MGNVGGEYRVFGVGRKLNSPLGFPTWVGRCEPWCCAVLFTHGVLWRKQVRRSGSRCGAIMTGRDRTESLWRTATRWRCLTISSTTTASTYNGWASFPTALPLLVSQCYAKHFKCTGARFCSWWLLWQQRGGQTGQARSSRRLMSPKHFISLFFKLDLHNYD